MTNTSEISGQVKSIDNRPLMPNQAHTCVPRFGWKRRPCQVCDRSELIYSLTS